MKRLSAGELIAGGELKYEVDIPSHILKPQQMANTVLDNSSPSVVQLRPLTVRDLQLITRAAKDNDSLTSALMVHTSLVEPELSLAQVNKLHVGLLQFLLDEINRISGISSSNEQLQMAAEDPLVRAAFILAREFGWTPEQVSDLTLGQIMLNLQLLKDKQTKDQLATA